MIPENDLTVSHKTIQKFCDMHKTKKPVAFLVNIEYIQFQCND